MAKQLPNINPDLPAISFTFTPIYQMLLDLPL